MGQECRAAGGRENPWLSLLLNIVVPVAVLNKLSEPDRLGPSGALVLALVFPLSYGVWDRIKRRQWNPMSLIGLASILLTGGIGLLSGANHMSLPQIVIDAEVAAMILRLVDGAEVSPATIMAATIERLGFSGSFLSDKETVRRLRAGEVFLPTIATRLSIEAWRARGRAEADDAADQVRAILDEAEARGPKLAADKAEALEDIVREASARS